MKKLVWLSIAFALFSCSNNLTFDLEGHIPEWGDDKILLCTYVGRTETIVDSCHAINGHFSFDMAVSHPEFAYVINMNKPTQFFSVIIEAGKMKAESNAEGRIQISGGSENRIMNQWLAEDEMIKQSMDKLDQSFRMVRGISAESEILKDSIRSKYIERGTDRRTLKLRYVNEYSESAFAVHLLDLNKKYMTLSELDNYLTNLSDEQKQTASYRSLLKHSEAKNKTKKGQIIPDFTMNTNDNEKLVLSEVYKQNKLTLIECWASWCGPCVADVPHLKKAYNAFHKSGFEIVAVSFDSNRDKWINKIEAAEMNWLNVSELTGMNNSVAKQYGISGVPANYLVDKNGIVLTTKLKGEQLYEFIDNYFKQ